MNENELLACFFPKLEERTAKELELGSGLSHETVFRLLKNLVKQKFLKEKKVGKTNVYEFIKNEFTYQIFVYYVTKRRLAFRQKHSLLYKRLLEFIDDIRPEGSAILFGSYAKGNETERSDIDILLVTKNRNVEKFARTYRTKYNLIIRPVTVIPSDFRNIKTDNPAFWADLFEYGIILDNAEYFFKEVYK